MVLKQNIGAPEGDDGEQSIDKFLDPRHGWILDAVTNNSGFKIILDPTVPTLCTPMGKKEIRANPELLKDKSPMKIVGFFAHEIGHHDENVRQLGNGMEFLLENQHIPGLPRIIKKDLDRNYVNVVEDVILESHQSRAPYQYLADVFTQNGKEILLDEKEISDLSEELFVQQFFAILLLDGRSIPLDSLKFHELILKDLPAIQHVIKRVRVPFDFTETWQRKLGVVNGSLGAFYTKYLKLDCAALGETNDKMWKILRRLIEDMCTVYSEDGQMTLPAVDDSLIKQEGASVVLPDRDGIKIIQENMKKRVTEASSNARGKERNADVEEITNLFGVNAETARYYLENKIRYAPEIEKIKQCFFDLIVKDRMVKITDRLPQGFAITPGLFGLGVSMAEQGIEQPEVFVNLSEYPKPGKIEAHFMIDVSASMYGLSLEMVKLLYLLFNQAFLEIKDAYSMQLSQTEEQVEDIYRCGLALFSDKVHHIIDESQDVSKALLLQGIQNISIAHGSGGTSSTSIAEELRKKTAEKQDAITHFCLLLSDGDIYDSSFEKTIQEKFGGKKDTYMLMIYTNSQTTTQKFSSNITCMDQIDSVDRFVDGLVAKFQTISKQMRSDRGNGDKNLQWSL